MMGTIARISVWILAIGLTGCMTLEETASNTVLNLATPTATPTATPKTSPTATPTATPTVTPTPTPLPSASPSPTVTADKCGNGTLDTGEFCDPSVTAAVACTSIGSVYSSGTAGCRTDCRGYDTSSCKANQVSAGTNGQIVIPKLRNPIAYGDAMCSNGEPYAYKLSLSPTGSKTWLIFWAGGGACDGSVIPCTDRSPDAFSPFGKTESPFTNYSEDDSGITSRNATKNPDFWDANIVLGKYCTNDLYSGTNAVPQKIMTGPSTSPTPKQLVFTGRRAVQGVLGSLVQYFGLDDRDPKVKIVYTGNSAGSDGMQNTSDVAVSTFPKAATDQRIWYVSSAAYMLANWNNPNYTLVGNGINETTNWKTIAKVYKAEIDPECSKFVQSQSLDPIFCYSGYWWYRTLTEKYKQSRILVFKNRQDQVYMGFHVIPFMSSKLTTAQLQVRTDWSSMQATELAPVKWLMQANDPDVVDGVIYQDNLHGIFVDYIWAIVPPDSMKANTCGTTAATSFRDLLHRFWVDTSPLTSSERYCFEGDWVTWAPPK